MVRTPLSRPCQEAAEEFVHRLAREHGIGRSPSALLLDVLALADRCRLDVEPLPPAPRRPDWWAVFCVVMLLASLAGGATWFLTEDRPHMIWTACYPVPFGPRMEP